MCGIHEFFCLITEANFLQNIPITTQKIDVQVAIYRSKSRNYMPLTTGVKTSLLHTYIIDISTKMWIQSQRTTTA